MPVSLSCLPELFHRVISVAMCGIVSIVCSNNVVQIPREVIWKDMTHPKE